MYRAWSQCLYSLGELDDWFGENFFFLLEGLSFRVTLLIHFDYFLSLIYVLHEQTFKPQLIA